VKNSLFITKRSGDSTLLNQIAEENRAIMDEYSGPSGLPAIMDRLSGLQSLKAQREGRGVRVFSVEGVRIGQE
jgi:hypothetical protein